MKCDVCKVNAATIGMQVRVNQHVQRMHLCADCYEQMRATSPISAGAFGGFPLEEWLQGFVMGIPQERQPLTMHPAARNRGVGGGGGFLDQFGRNVTDLAKQGKIDPVIGRDREIARVIEILNRRNKNNPVLIGEPGVGKTAIAEGLALNIVEGRVPTKLRGKQVYVLDVGSLVADTGIRGQFEERMKQLIESLQARQDVILFIDEIHLLVGAGSAQGSMDAGNLLKPALARGDIQVIGATTLKEYRQIEKDAALERRFQPVMVNEPSEEAAVKILKGIRDKYEAYHHVSYPDDVLKACVRLSQRYIQDRYLPDKAIDLLDEAGSKVNLRTNAGGADELRTRLEQVLKAKDDATRREAYEEAAKLRDEEQRLRAQLQQVQTEGVRPVVTVADIEAIIEEKTGIPVQALQADEQAKLKDLESRLNRQVIGQPEAVKQVTRAIRRSRAGLKASTRPIGSFLFVGPTGVGKTELAKCLAEALFGTKDALIRLDMSEYMEKHSVSKLIGSPPGYVGFEEAGQLTERVRRNPYSLILVDEIEKAHPDVQHIFLQIMDDGRLTDSQGRTVSFKDTVIIMTSNAGAADRKVTVGFGVDGKQAQAAKPFEALGAYFKPEFLNRFDAIVPFNELQEGDLMKIVDLLLEDVRSGLKERGIALEVTDAAKRKLVALGYHPAFGARPLRRAVQSHVEDAMADILLEHPDIRALTVDVVNDEVVVRSK